MNKLTGRIDAKKKLRGKIDATKKMLQCNINTLPVVLAGEPLPFVAQKIPIAYTYNGVTAPVLPECDNGKFQFAIITEYNGLHLYIFGNEPYLKYNKVTTRGPTEILTYFSYHYNYYSGWEYKKTDTLESGQQRNFTPADIRWSNHDILNASNGKIFLAASEPVPIYER